MSETFMASISLSAAIARAASSRSPVRRTSRIRSRFWSTRTAMSSTWRRSCSSSSVNCWRRVTMPTSTEPPRHVVLGALVGRVGEDLLGAVVLDEDPRTGVARLVHLGGEEGATVRYPSGLLHVVGDDDDGVLLLELGHEILDAAGRDRIERRARFVHEDDLGIDGH